jgi:hypothetical protein
MKRTLNKLIRCEKGQALIIAMILMLLGSLIIAPMLAYMGSGLKVGKDVHEERMDELYAADAGAEDALWYIQNIERLKQLVEHVTGGSLPAGWTPQSYDGWPLPAYNLGDINGKGVEVTVDYIPYDDYDKYFKITSKATSRDDLGNAISSTTINSYNKIPIFTNLLDNAITSRGTVNLKPGTEVDDGDVVYCTEPAPPEDQVIGGEVRQDCAVAWPPADALSEFYLGDVDGFDFNNDTINVQNTPTIGPLYRNGDLTINKSGGGGNALLTLQDTVYVTGKLTIGTTNQNFTLNLNGQTIFVENASIDPDKAINIGGKTTIIGSGCIIAVGYVYFQPKIDTTPDNFVFIMSVEDKVKFQPQPGSKFYGSVAGDVNVELWPGGTFTWVPWENEGLNFPGANPNQWIPPKIKTWEISTWIK